MAQILIIKEEENHISIMASKRGNNFGDQIITLTYSDEKAIIEEKEWSNEEGSWESFDKKSMTEKAKRYWPHKFKKGE